MMSAKKIFTLADTLFGVMQLPLNYVCALVRGTANGSAHFDAVCDLDGSAAER